MLLSYLFSEPHITTLHSNIGVQIIVVFDLGTSILHTTPLLAEDFLMNLHGDFGLRICLVLFV